jgi:lysophospholipid acyltransferase (LPLAT)-like uncharacterized protein
MRLGVAAGGRAIDALLHSVKFVEYGDSSPMTMLRPAIILLWHGRLLPATFYHRNQGFTALVSRSGDGELIARLIRRWGYDLVRGSSSQGGSEALRQIVRTLRAGASVAITPDGPRGPRRKMKPGAILAASMAGVPLIPLSTGARRAWWFGKWDQFLVPRPMATVKIVYGPPLYVPERASPEELEAASAAAEEALEAATRQADEP